MRNTLARSLYELAKEDERIVVLVADISPAGAMEDFRREFPDRFINTGVAEAAMIGLAAGLAMRGFKPFCYTIATFALFRPYEFIRCDLAYQNLPVTIVGMGAGLAYPTLGGTHQAIEDVAVAMACPNLAVLVPCDPAETAACARWCAARESGGPVYMRIGKAGEPGLIARAPPLEIGSRWFRGIRNASKETHDLVLSYGSIALLGYALAQHIDADMAVVPMLSDDMRPMVGALLDGYRRVVVVEEASGGPLALRLGAWQSEVEVVSASLPRDFSHAYGTRAELLDAAGLSVEKIAAALNGGR